LVDLLDALVMDDRTHPVRDASIGSRAIPTNPVFRIS